MSRVLCRHAAPRGAVSRGFTAEHLMDALKRDHTEHVYMELDGDGKLTAHGARGPAPLAAAARLAPAALAAAAVLHALPAPTAPTAPPGAALAPPALALRLTAPLAPHQELLLWFAEDALAALDMPFLTLRNIGPRGDYACHRCGAAFDDPNPLKVHLFLSCEHYERRAFWARAAPRLAAGGPGAAAPRADRPGAGAPPADPAALEALAAAWGRSRGGHVCVFCGKLYSRRYGLKIHLRTHTGYRPLRCRYCLRAFGDPSNLNKHVRLHARGVCGRAAARRRDLERHQRTHAQHAHTLRPENNNKTQL